MNGGTDQRSIWKRFYLAFPDECCFLSSGRFMVTVLIALREVLDLRSVLVLDTGTLMARLPNIVH